MIDSMELLHEAELFAKSATCAELFRRLDEHYTAAWKSAQTVAAREHAHSMVMAVVSLQAELNGLIANPKVSIFNHKSTGVHHVLARNPNLR